MISYISGPMYFYVVIDPRGLPLMEGVAVAKGNVAQEKAVLATIIRDEEEEHRQVTLKYQQPKLESTQRLQEAEAVLAELEGKMQALAHDVATKPLAQLTTDHVKVRVNMRPFGQALNVASSWDLFSHLFSLTSDHIAKHRGVGIYSSWKYYDFMLRKLKRS